MWPGNEQGDILSEHSDVLAAARHSHGRGAARGGAGARALRILLGCVAPAACDCCVNCRRGHGTPASRPSCGRRSASSARSTAGALLVAARVRSPGVLRPRRDRRHRRAREPPRRVAGAAEKRPLEPRPVAVLPGEVGRWKTARTARRVRLSQRMQRSARAGGRRGEGGAVDDAASGIGSKADIAPPADDADDDDATWTPRSSPRSPGSTYTNLEPPAARSTSTGTSPRPGARPCDSYSTSRPPWGIGSFR